MTDHQLRLLDALGDATSNARPGPAQREAVRAILAERDVLLKMCERVSAMFGWKHDIHGVIHRANGGP